MNELGVGDSSRYILRAAALKEGKPNQYESVAKDLPNKRVKVEYVKCEFKHAWEAVMIIENGGSFFVKKTDGLSPFWAEIKHLHGAVSDWEFACSKVEVEIDERQEFIDAACEITDWNIRKTMGMLFDSGKFKLITE